MIGAVLRYLTAGESHGRGLVVIVEGLPAGVPVSRDGVAGELARRRHGYGRGGRQRFEADAFEIQAGGRHGRTIGSPVAITIPNVEFEQKYAELMAADGTDDPSKALTRPRPGHADLAGALKYGFDDVRNVLERASARETAARVAGGALCKAFLHAVGVEVRSHVVQIGDVPAARREGPLTVADFEGVDDDKVRCLDPQASRAMVEHINKQRKANESIGGGFEVIAFGLGPGLGSHVSWEERLDGRIGGALCSIQAAKGVAFGDGFDLAGAPGSQSHDEIFWDQERGYHRETNHAGGLEGGMTTGQPLVARVAMKPIPTLTKPLRSVDIDSHEPAQALRERTDSCVVPAAGVVGEAMLAYVLADAYRRKFGGDHIDDVREAVERYTERIAWQG